MTYKIALQWMFEQLPMYQRVGSVAYKKDLTNALAFAKILQHPEKQFSSIHIAGTNGKGSTSSMLASVLQEAGYRVGLYTSPHLKDFRERIRVNGACIPKRYVSQFIEKYQPFLQEQGLSFFEMTVGLAFDYFAHEKIDFAVIEVGLGGRLDSTNIITPVLSVITNIGFDHVQMLGNTLPEIAFEKAGIIKNNVPVIIGEYHSETYPVFEKIAREKKSKLYLASNFTGNIPDYALKGSYQIHNVKNVLQSVNVLNQIGYSISDIAVQKGLLNVVQNTGLLGRWQILQHNPLVVADTAHNAHGLAYTLEQIETYTYEQLHIVLGMVNDKDLDKILPLFPQKAKYYFCQPKVPRALDKNILQQKARTFGLNGNAYSSVKNALRKALQSASMRDFIYVGGSTFVVAEVV